MLAHDETGALYVRRGTPLSPLVVGASREGGLRPGTENELWAALSVRVNAIRRHTPDDASLANTLLVSFPGVLGVGVLTRVPQLAASTGCACHAGEHTQNATLLAGALDALVAATPSLTSPGTSSSSTRKGTPG